MAILLSKSRMCVVAIERNAGEKQLTLVDSKKAIVELLTKKAAI